MTGTSTLSPSMIALSMISFKANILAKSVAKNALKNHSLLIIFWIFRFPSPED